MSLLEISNLSLSIGKSVILKDLTLAVEPGEIVAVTGESGSGKSMTALSVMQLLPEQAMTNGRIKLDDRDLLTLPEPELCSIRGRVAGMVFQEPMTALNPVKTIGDQVAETILVHKAMSRPDARIRADEVLQRVGLPANRFPRSRYPHELSGGQRQRVVIAMAIALRPKLLIADEPTTALDVTTQAQVLGLIRSLQAETGMGVILVTHDLGVVANMAQRVVVMNKGRVMERGDAQEVLGSPAHPYTAKLFAAAPMIPAVAAPAPASTKPADDVILDLRDVSKTYTMRAGGWRKPVSVSACQHVDLQLPRGKTLAIVGESGSGKTTCARIAMGAERPDAGGEVLFRPDPAAAPLAVHDLSPTERTAFQRQAQMVFQDPYSSLSPRMRVQQALTEPMEVHNIGTARDRREKAAEMLRWVGLNPDMLGRFPHAFSGGQRQRLSIARALTLDPKLLICDEPTSALDVSVQEQILTLLEDIRDRANLSYLFISHDLAVVARIADEVAVMRAGVIVEQAPPDTLFYNPQHPYTRALIAAQPEPDISRPIDLDLVAKGAGSPTLWPEQFRFEGHHAPALRELEPGHKVRCHA